ncbi:MerR family transcriptional regulator [Micromonospora craniellae]|uniref:MerR family transcriptional regulator n=1 Tax=Micromonospora craniellae TaxID=2294034 RepID=UPI0018F26AA8
MSTHIDIGEVVRRTGVPVSTLHLWERRGLMSHSHRDRHRARANRVLPLGAVALHPVRRAAHAGDVRTRLPRIRTPGSQVDLTCLEQGTPRTAAAISSLTCWDAVGVVSVMEAATC